MSLTVRLVTLIIRKCYYKAENDKPGNNIQRYILYLLYIKDYGQYVYIYVFMYVSVCVYRDVHTHIYITSFTAGNKKSRGESGERREREMNSRV